VAMIVRGRTVWEEVSAVRPTSIQQVRCLVVDDPLHCYLTDHDVVTHNCITFAAQDFSSLQKASKEEADATWENTNVRCVGRLTSGSESETLRRILGVANEALVQMGGGKEHRQGEIMDSYVTNRDTRPDRVKRIEYDDLAAQENGEFTFLIGKKSSGGRGGVRIIRARTFYTQVKEAPAEIRVNHFLKVEPPRLGNGDRDMEVIDALEEAFRALLVSGAIRETFPDEFVMTPINAQSKTLAQLSLYIREAMKTHRLSRGEATRVALVCAEADVGLQQQEAARIAQTAMTTAPSEIDAALSDSVESVSRAAANAVPEATGAINSYLDDDDLLSRVSVVTPAVPEVELPGPVKEGAGEQGEGESGESSGSGGGVTLFPIPDPIESEDAIRVVGNMLANYLSDIDLDADSTASDGAASDDTAQGSGSNEKPPTISLLTLRPLESDQEPSEIASYIEDTLVDADLAIGEKTDTDAIRMDARNAVQAMEKQTSYVDGVTPEPATLKGFDDILDGVVRAAESNYSVL